MMSKAGVNHLAAKLKCPIPVIGNEHLGMSQVMQTSS